MGGGERASATAFVRELAFADLPDDVVASARRSLLDLIGIAAAGNRTRAAHIATAFATSELCGAKRGARILFDGRRASLAGASFAGAKDLTARTEVFGDAQRVARTLIV